MQLLRVVLSVKHIIYNIQISRHKTDCTGRHRFLILRLKLHKWSRFSIGYRMTRYCTMSHIVLPFCLRAQLIIRRPPQIYLDASNELLNAQNSHIITLKWWVTWKVLEIISEVLKEWHIPVNSIIYLFFGHCQLHFSPITLHMRLVSKYFYVFDAKPFFSKSKYQIRVFPLCFPDIPIFFRQCML